MKIRPLHDWVVSPREAIRIQQELRGRVRIEKFSGKPSLAAGADVHFRDGQAVAALVIVEYPSFLIVEQFIKKVPLKFPYVPGLLAFREGPALIEALSALASEPDVFFFDGQGLAHPRRMGLASHIGLFLDRPSLGCAKSLYIGQGGEPAAKRGSRRQLKDRGETIGVTLRTKDGVRPVYVSVGHRMDLASAIRLVLLFSKGYRIPEPLRIAHQLAGGM
ncbi:MAG: endonuclease V [bacterium]